MEIPETITGLAPDDSGYNEARLDFNTRFPPAPSRYIDFCRSHHDVSRAIRLSRGHGYPLRGRSGSYEDHSVVDGGVVIDVSPSAPANF